MDDLVYDDSPRRPFGLVFASPAPVRSDPNRADIACFVGFVRRRADHPVSPEIARWLTAGGWRRDDELTDAEQLRAEQLLDVPTPIDAWDVFHDLFAWEQLTEGQEFPSTYLGAAVRSYFAQGGRKCYVVRAGDPLPLSAPRGQRLARLAKLIPGYPFGFEGAPVDAAASWRGVAHLFGLPDVSFLCLPDLPAAVAADAPPPPEPQVIDDRQDERFVECAPDETRDEDADPGRRIRPPSCHDEHYRDWARAVNMTANTLARFCPEVQLVAAVPIPEPGSRSAANLLDQISGDDGPLAFGRDADREGIGSAFVQLAYPWVRTPGSATLPGSLESPDAVLAGILARNAMSRGTFRSAANLTLGDVYAVDPPLRQTDQQRRRPIDARAVELRDLALVERVSLFGPTPSGLRLLSDVTTSLDQAYRPASLNRLMAALVRAARRTGEDSVFDPAGERLWTRIRDRMNSLLDGLLEVGALRGATPDEAFEVRCDRTTMTQNDLDNGRVIVTIAFSPAVPIGRVVVVLAMSEGGVVALSREAA